MSRIQTALSGFPARTSDQPEVFPTAWVETHALKSGEGLALTVAFTSERATAAALRYAAQLAGGLSARLQVIIPQVVPYGRDLNDPDVRPEVTAKRAIEAIRASGVDADVNVVLCRDRAEGLHSALGPEGLVLIGGGGHWWSFSERKLTRQLADLGHKVLFVEGEHPRREWPFRSIGVNRRDGLALWRFH